MSENEAEVKGMKRRIALLEVFVSELLFKTGLTEVDELYERAAADMQPSDGFKEAST